MKTPTDSERLDFLIAKQARLRLWRWWSTGDTSAAVQIGPAVHFGATHREAIDIAMRELNTEGKKAA